jgi:hypothetical protein
MLHLSYTAMLQRHMRPHRTVTAVKEDDCIFLGSLHRAERAIAERLLTLAKGELPWASIDPDKAIPWIADG